jgi:membrane-associated phospholipid phosphatase
VKTFFKNNALVTGMYLIMLIVAVLFILSYEKIAINVYLNQYVGNGFFDAFFFYITYLGDGRVAALLLLLILVYNVRTGIYAIFSFLSATIVSNTLKYTLFDDVDRPWFIYQWIEKHHNITYVKGVDLHLHNSFPSGHATQAFAILMSLAFVIPNKFLKLLLLLLAVLTSLSRVYLSQHWLIDITAGSVIGIGFSILYYYAFIHKDKFSKLNRSLFAFKTS